MVNLGLDNSTDVMTPHIEEEMLLVHYQLMALKQKEPVDHLHL